MSAEGLWPMQAALFAVCFVGWPVLSLVGVWRRKWGWVMAGTGLLFVTGVLTLVPYLAGVCLIGASVIQYMTALTYFRWLRRTPPDNSPGQYSQY